MTPVQMTYFYEYVTVDAAGKKTTHGGNTAQCKAYKFSNVDAFGAMALCYFQPGVTLKYGEEQHDARGYPTGVIAEKTHTVGDNGEWMPIHVRNLKPA